MKKKLKDLLKESNVWDRKFGESLPTFKQCVEKHAAKQKIKESVPKRFHKAKLARGGISTKKHSVKLIAHRMKINKSREFGDSAAKALIKKYGSSGVSEHDLQMDLPDYITGSGISSLFIGLQDEGKLTEAKKETILHVALRVLKNRTAEKYKSKKGLVMIDLQSANLLVKVFNKVNDKMKKILLELGYSNPKQLMNMLWTVAKAG